MARHTTVVAMPVTKPTALAHAESLQQRCARPTLSRSRTATGAGYSQDESRAAAPAASGLGWGRGWDFACCRANSAAGLELRGPGRLSRCDELCVPEVAQLQPVPQRSWPARVGLVSGGARLERREECHGHVARSREEAAGDDVRDGRCARRDAGAKTPGLLGLL